jgi:hypothetical protein
MCKIMLCVYSIVHNIYTYNVLIISYYIRISEFKKILNVLYSNYTYIFEVCHVLKHNGYVRILKIQKCFSIYKIQ